MSKAEKIVRHRKFLQYIEEIEIIERERVYCRHGLAHLLDVARIAWIRNLEEGSPCSRDLIYGAALLHDIGKVRQYQDGTPHEISGAQEAAVILADCGYGQEETAQIQKAILAHRRGSEQDGDRLSAFLYTADKLSRPCYLCPAEHDCKWTQEQKNRTLVY